jgi:hypothetical protein
MILFPSASPDIRSLPCSVADLVLIVCLWRWLFGVMIQLADSFVVWGISSRGESDILHEFVWLVTLCSSHCCTSTYSFSHNYTRNYPVRITYPCVIVLITSYISTNLPYSTIIITRPSNAWSFQSRNTPRILRCTMIPVPKMAIWKNWISLENGGREE